MVIHVYLYIHTSTYIYMKHIHICIYMFIQQGYIYIYTCTYICIYVHVYICTYISVGYIEQRAVESRDAWFAWCKRRAVAPQQYQTHLRAPYYAYSINKSLWITHRASFLMSFQRRRPGCDSHSRINPLCV